MGLMQTKMESKQTQWSLNGVAWYHQVYVQKNKNVSGEDTEHRKKKNAGQEDQYW